MQSLQLEFGLGGGHLVDSSGDSMVVKHLFISRGHNFFGHHGQAAGTNPVIERPDVECVAGKGIRGDRFFEYQEDYKGQITFFSLDVLMRSATHSLFHFPRLGSFAAM